MYFRSWILTISIALGLKWSRTSQQREYRAEKGCSQQGSQEAQKKNPEISNSKCFTDDPSPSALTSSSPSNCQCPSKVTSSGFSHRWQENPYGSPTSQTLHHWTTCESFRRVLHIQIIIRMIIVNNTKASVNATHLSWAKPDNRYSFMTFSVLGTMEMCTCGQVCVQHLQRDYDVHSAT